MYQMDTNLVPEAAELYGKLGVKKAPLSLIAPQFETPLPPLQPAVFPPARASRPRRHSISSTWRRSSPANGVV